MTILAHISYPSLLFIFIFRLLHIRYTIIHLLILIISSIIPDIDYLYHKLINKGKFDYQFQHHQWLTHKPITYSPLLLILIFYPHIVIFLICFGIYSHFILDTMFGGDGIMWLYPFSKKFFSLFSKKTKGFHGKDWMRVYQKLGIYKIDIISYALLLVIIVVQLIKQN